jgi:hypothetical protein
LNQLYYERNYAAGIGGKVSAGNGYEGHILLLFPLSSIIIVHSFGGGVNSQLI